MSAQTVFIILNCLSIIITTVCCIAVIRQTASYMQKLALLICVTVTVCCIGFFIKSQASDVGVYIAGQMLAYSVVPHGCFLVFLFVLAYCRFSIPSSIKAICCGLNLFISFGVLTMNFHPYFYESVLAVPMDGFVEFEKVYGPLHDFTVAFLMLYLLATVVLAIVFSIKNYRRKNYVWKIILAVLIPFSAYLLPKMIDTNADFKSISAALFCVVLLYLIYQNKLYDIDNIMTKYSVESMDEAFIVFDNNYSIKGWNAVAEKLFPVVLTLDLDCDVRKYDTPFEAFLDGAVSEMRSDDKIFGVSVLPVGDRNAPEGRVIRVEDITVQRNYTLLLQENMDRIKQDLDMAAAIQQAALPNVQQLSAAVPQVDAAAFQKTAKEVGGDFYDFYRLDENRVLFLIADVSGKGIPASLFMMRAKTIIRSLAEEGLDVNKVFDEADTLLKEGNKLNMFLTAWMGILDLRSGHLSFVNAGHDRPIILRADGRVEPLESQPGFVLGILGRNSYAPQELILKPGDGIFLYTDGVVDATDDKGERFGQEKLLGSVRGCEKLAAAEALANVRENVERFAAATEQFDDITGLMLKYLG